MIRQVRTLLLLMRSLERNFMLTALPLDRSSPDGRAHDPQLSTLLLRRDVRHLIAILRSLRNKAGVDLDALMHVASRAVGNASQEPDGQLDLKLLINFRETLKSGMGQLDKGGEVRRARQDDVNTRD